MKKTNKTKDFLLKIMGVVIVGLFLYILLWMYSCHLASFLKPCHETSWIYTTTNFMTKCGGISPAECKK